MLGLLAFRIVWGLVGTHHARFASFAHSPRAALRYFRDELTGHGRRYLGHNPAGSWAVYGLLLLGVATGVTGFLTFNEIGGEAFEEVHEVCANAWLALVVLHVLGVMFSSLVQRENLARAMITGYKSGPADGDDVRPLVGVGVAVRPRQRPHPPIAVTSIRPDSRGPQHGGRSRLAGISATYVGRHVVRAQIRSYVDGRRSAGLSGAAAGWRVARSVFVADDEATARR